METDIEKLQAENAELREKLRLAEAREFSTGVLVLEWQSHYRYLVEKFRDFARGAIPSPFDRRRRIIGFREEFLAMVEELKRPYPKLMSEEEVLKLKEQAEEPS